MTIISAGTTDMPWWSGKQIIREYLEAVNRNEKVCNLTPLELPQQRLTVWNYRYLNTLFSNRGYSSII